MEMLSYCGCEYLFSSCLVLLLAGTGRYHGCCDITTSLVGEPCRRPRIHVCSISNSSPFVSGAVSFSLMPSGSLIQLPVPPFLQSLDKEDVYVWIDAACLPDNVRPLNKGEESSCSKGQAVAEAVAAADAAVAQTECQVSFQKRGARGWESLIRRKKLH